ncbi:MULTISPECIES: collagen-like protein [Cyanophyceae]|uniref:collagen-like triple helix repeat-containing protein n=1 Tax=Cyanophyceae TaxID=3028117 RepID=UPI0016838CB9|nr:MULTISPECIES: collagen-like protein [Cyanophyceae]MBD1917448.1 collagen-like protein [Phormidium sp. FACHB-77]MBD2032307.1 collagen-like protein [Phormidium sp. FACHB-322]MBD2052245.1 collagen-like protein [Leptolyngbya sp. FACHB-60]
MSAECDALMQKLNAIESRLSAMDGKYIPKADRGNIVNDGANKGQQIAKAAIIPLFGAYTLKTVHDSDFRAALMRAQNALSEASTAKGIAVVSKSEALAAAAKAKKALQESAQAYFKSVDAQQLATRAYEVGKGAEFEAIKAKILGQSASSKATQASKLAETAKGVAATAKTTAETAVGKANHALSKIDEVVARFSRLIDDVAAKAARALGTALDAVGVSKAAQATAGKAFGIALKALGKIFLILDILSTIFSILNAIDLRRRMNILEQKISIIEREISQILGTLFGIVSRLKNVQNAAEYAQLIARQAVQLGEQATSIALQARSTAASALTQAGIAIAGVAGATALAGAANARAKTAQATATEALTRARVPGPRGLQGIQGLRGVQGLKGAQGLRGAVGARGRDGINGIGVTNIKPVTIIQRITTPGKVVTLVRNNNKTVVNNIMKPADLALLRKIDATTSATAVRQNAHLAISTTTNGIAASSRAYLTTMQNFAATAWQSTRIQKVINALTLISAIHNAAMLSRFTGQTLLEAMSGALDLFGIDDEQGNRLDLNTMLGKSVESLLKNVLGEEVYNDTSKAWQKANRVVQIGSNIVWSVRSIMDTSLELSEYIANNTGKIGNSLKRFGIVGENAFPDMSESARAPNKWRSKVDKWMAGAETVENIAETVEYVTQAPLEIVSELGEIEEQRLEARKIIAEGEPVDYPANEPIAIVQAENKENSVGAEPTVEASQRSAS